MFDLREPKGNDIFFVGTDEGTVICYRRLKSSGLEVSPVVYRKGTPGPVLSALSEEAQADWERACRAAGW